jgi:hypothetical protein
VGVNETIALFVLACSHYLGTPQRGNAHKKRGVWGINYFTRFLFYPYRLSPLER